MASLLSASGLGVWRGDNLLLDDFSLDVAAGDVIQILGSNGSGKTTLLRILCGLALADEGEVLWQGQPIERVREPFHSSLLYLGHKSGIKAALTPVENLRLFATLAAVDSRHVNERIDKALAALSLQNRMHLRCASLSAGQQRRVSLARLVLEPARLWVLDEPLTALDSGGLQWVTEQIDSHVRSGGTVVFTSHHALALDGVNITSIGLDA